MITGRTRVLALLGHPVARSLSPALHNHWLRSRGIDAVYVALPCPAGADAAAVLRGGLWGANLTTPHKRTILGDLASLTDDARAIGAVNTVVVGPDGALHGDNTDAAGLRASLGELAARPAIVLGAGGAARAAVHALRRSGSPSITVLNRTRATAEALASDLGPVGVGPLTSEGFAAVAPSAGLVVNATTAGAREVVASLAVGALPSDAAWCDLNYWDPDPPGFAACRATGRRCVDGGGMLLHQAALAFHRFTGIALDAAEIAAAWGAAVSAGRSG